MNTEHSPFAAFTLDSSAGRERHGGQPQTLTVRLARPNLLASFGMPMSGSVQLDVSGLRSEGLLRAAILPVEGTELTITF